MKRKERKMKRIHKGISLVLAAAMACWGCPAYAEEAVSVPDAPPAVEVSPVTSADLASAMSAEPVQLAMYYVVPADPSADIEPAKRGALPIVASAGTGRDTQLGVNLSAASAQAEREGWPWYAKAGVVVGCVLVVGLATWGIVEASHKGSHDNDASTHYTIYGDDGSTLNVRIGADNNSTSTTTGW